MNQYQTSPFSMPPVVKNLIMINIVMLVATYSLRTMGIDLTEKLGLFYPGSEHFRPYQFITHLFMHGDFFHLLFNMFALFMFGKVLEMVWGPRRFLIYFFVTGLGAAALHSFVTYLEISALQKSAAAFINTPSPDLLAAFVKAHLSHPATGVMDLVNNWGDAPNNPVLIQQGIDVVRAILEMKIDIPTVGASGAIFGVLLGFGYLFPNTELMLLFPPVPIKAKYFVMGYGGIELYLGITESNSNIAHFAHLGGMLFGFILLRYWSKNTNKFY
jgi:membrane associated rhomboid family serine protease